MYIYIHKPTNKDQSKRPHKGATSQRPLADLPNRHLPTVRIFRHKTKEVTFSERVMSYMRDESRHTYEKVGHVVLMKDSHGWVVSCM